MSTLPLPAQRSMVGWFRRAGALHDGAVRAAWAAALAILGVFSVWSTALLLWALWTTDPLKSIGGFVPLVSLLLILRVWRALGWETRGSWWGLALLTVAVAVVHLRDHAVLELVLSPSWSITLPPHSLVAFVYASGVVLLFGGTTLWRAALFPLLLMWFVNPVPHVFTRFVDLPLQHVSAEVARGLAHTLGQRLMPDQLTLMFTPDFGMFIAPGCDGIRGSVTMGFLALVAGYLYRFRARVWLLVVTAAVLLGYLFNLLRLCVLVLYYVLALHWRGLQGHAEMADYCIGATLFFFAAILGLAAVRRLGAGGELRIPALRFAEPSVASEVADRSFWWRWASFAVLVAAASAPYTRAWLRPAPETAGIGAAQGFPESVGAYQLRRTWPERLLTGQTIFWWAEYGKPGVGSAVAVGVSPTLGAHDTLLCHAARGEDWIWHGSMELPTPNGPVSFSGSLYNDGTTEYLEATTICSGGRCGQWTSERTHLGLVYSRPNLNDVTGAEPGRPIPVLLRVETGDTSLSGDQARVRLTEDMRDFLAYAPLVTFTSRSRQP